MSARLDTVQLDRAWDALVLGTVPPHAAGDANDRDLLALLAAANCPEPSRSFVRSLERELLLPPNSEATPIASTSSRPRNPRAGLDRQWWWQRPPSRWMTAGYALAAIALVIALSTVAISRQRSSLENVPAIPAVSGWIDSGPPTSPDVETTTLFSRTLSLDELATYQRDHWTWIGVSQGTMPPGAQAVIAEGSPEAGDAGFNGLGAVSVTSGTLLANAATGAWVLRGSTGTVEQVDRSTSVTLANGDTLFAPANTLPALWNRSDSDATYLAGGVYTESNITPLNEMDFDFARSGVQIDPNDLSIGLPVTMSMETVSIPAGSHYSYSINAETWLEAFVNGGALQQVKRVDGVPEGEPKTLVESVYSLHANGAGDYTLTNDGPDEVSVSFFRVETSMAPDKASTPPASNKATVESFSSRTFDQTELAQLQSNDWGWIGITRETIAPGQQSQAVTASSEEMNPSGTGLTMTSVEQGTLAATLDAGAWVQRGAAGATEHIEQSATVTLQAGDTLFSPPSALRALWNPGKTDATYLEGAVHTSILSSLGLSNPNAHTAQWSAVVNGNLLAIGAPLTMTLVQTVIGPGETYAYPISSATWLLALVDGSGLQQHKEIQGVEQGSPQALPEGSYALHEQGFGTYALTNTGTEAVDVSFYRVEPAAQPSPNTLDTTRIETLFNQTLTPEQLQTFRLSDWRWVSFIRNTIPPQGDTGAFITLRPSGKNVFPGINVMVVETGSLAVMPDSAVLVARGTDGTLQSAPAGVEILLAPGDALLYLPDTAGRFWNPTGSDTVVIGGGGYLRPSAPTFNGGVRDMDNNRLTAGQLDEGMAVTPGDLPIDGPVTIAIERISISPGGNATISMDSTHWTVAVVIRGDLQQVSLVDGQPAGPAVPVKLRELVLQPGEDQTAQLTNVGSDEAVLYLMRIEPTDDPIAQDTNTPSPTTS